MNMTKRLLVTAVVIGTAVFSFPANAQLSNGSVTHKSPSELNEQKAAAIAGFGSLLSNALTPASIQSFLKAAGEMPALPPSASINFNNVTAPCFFDETTALRGIEQGGYFDAPGTNGGGILNTCSNFGIQPLTPPNFLAFNNQTFYDNGGIPQLPQVFHLASTTSVSFSVSGGLDGAGYPIALIAMGSGVVQSAVTSTLTSSWVQVTLTGTDITAVAVVGQPYLLLIDDITAQ